MVRERKNIVLMMVSKVHNARCSQAGLVRFHEEGRSGVLQRQKGWDAQFAQRWRAVVQGHWFARAVHPGTRWLGVFGVHACSVHQQFFDVTRSDLSCCWWIQCRSGSAGREAGGGHHQVQGLLEEKRQAEESPGRDQTATVVTFRASAAVLLPHQEEVRPRGGS